MPFTNFYGTYLLGVRDIGLPLFIVSVSSILYLNIHIWCLKNWTRDQGTTTVGISPIEALAQHNFLWTVCISPIEAFAPHKFLWTVCISPVEALAPHSFLWTVCISPIEALAPHNFLWTVCISPIEALAPHNDLWTVCISPIEAFRFSPYGECGKHLSCCRMVLLYAKKLNVCLYTLLQYRDLCEQFFLF